MAPPAPQRASLQKYCRADSRAVMDGIALYIKNCTILFIHNQYFEKIIPDRILVPWQGAGNEGPIGKNKENGFFIAQKPRFIGSPRILLIKKPDFSDP